VSTSPSAGAAAPRRALLARGIRLEVLTVGWNVVEAVVGIGAALAAGSMALLGFGVDSIVESLSGLVLLWRLGAEQRGADRAAVERIETRAERLVGLSLLALAVFVAVGATTRLLAGERPEASPVGIALASLSLLVMWWLARAKARLAADLGSRSLAADAFQTTACFWLSAIVLVGVGLNTVLGWWWADPLAALVMSVVIVREGLEALRGGEGEAAWVEALEGDDDEGDDAAADAADRGAPAAG
jgi:cation diffusion facilitator family transporter